MNTSRTQESVQQLFQKKISKISHMFVNKVCLVFLKTFRCFELIRLLKKLNKNLAYWFLKMCPVLLFFWKILFEFKFFFNFVNLKDNSDKNKHAYVLKKLFVSAEKSWKNFKNLKFVNVTDKKMTVCSTNLF